MWIFASGKAEVWCTWSFAKDATSYSPAQHLFLQRQYPCLSPGWTLRFCQMVLCFFGEELRLGTPKCTIFVGELHPPQKIYSMCVILVKYLNIPAICVGMILPYQWRFFIEIPGSHCHCDEAASFVGNLADEGTVIEWPNLLLLPGGGLREVNVYSNIISWLQTQKPPKSVHEFIGQQYYVKIYDISYFNSQYIISLLQNTHLFFTLMVFTAIHPFFNKSPLKELDWWIWMDHSGLRSWSFSMAMGRWDFSSTFKPAFSRPH